MAENLAAPISLLSAVSSSHRRGWCDAFRRSRNTVTRSAQLEISSAVAKLDEPTPRLPIQDDGETTGAIPFG